MMNNIPIDREIKLTLLKALKNGYFELSDIENLIRVIYSGTTQEERKVIFDKLGIEDVIEVTFDL